MQAAACVLVTLLVLPSLVTPRRPGKAARPAPHSRLILRNLYLRNCNNAENYVLIVGTPLVHQQRDGAHLIDVNISFSKPVQKLNRLQLSVNKCREAVSYNTCEYFTTWSWRVGLCQLLTMPGMMWSPIFDGVTPRLECPIKKGIYSFVNASYDLDHPLSRSFEGYVWTGAFSADDQDDVAAVCIQGAMVAVNTKA